MIAQAVVLDVDDTLFLERDYVRSGLAAVGDHLRLTRGIQGFSDLAWSLFVGGTRCTIIDEALLSLGEPPDPALTATLVDVYRRHTPDIRLLPDADRFLAQAARLGIPLAVVTDGPVDSQRRKLSALGLGSLTDVLVVTAEHGTAWHKPSLPAFLHVQAAFGLDGPSLAYIGDNPAKDFAGPWELGWTTVRVRRTGSLHEMVDSGADVDLEVQRLDELPT